jgi:hypothetical protein
MKRSCLSILCFMLMTSSCVRRVGGEIKPPELSDHWAVAKSMTTADQYILVKSPLDLEKALEHIGCASSPCSVGRVGEVYVVTRADAANRRQKQSSGQTR